MDGSRSARMAHQRMERAHRRAIEHSMKALRAPTTPAAVTVRNGLCEPCEPCHPRPWGANTASYRVALGGHPQAGQSRAGSATQRQACKACHAGFSGPDGESIDRITLKDGSNFHLSCFRCSECDEALVASGDGEASGELVRYYERDAGCFCENCFRVLYGKTCGVCAAKLLRWHTQGGRAYCPKHDEENLPVCLGCRQLMSRGSVCATLADGRFACARCHARAVDDIEEARRLYREVTAFFGKSMGLPMPLGSTELCIELLDRDALLHKMSTRLSRGHMCCPLGLTCTEELTSTATGQVLPESRRIKSISIVTHLPADLCASTLAHEAGHVYLHLQGLDEAGSHALRDRVAEGLCELFSYLWDQSRKPSDEHDERERRRRLLVMETSSDPIYGQGFRDALAGYRACGNSLSLLLHQVKESGGALPRANGPQAEMWAKQAGRAWQGRTGAFHAVGEAPRVDSWLRARAFDESRRVRMRSTQVGGDAA